MARGVRMVRWCMRGRKALSALGSCKSAKGCIHYRYMTCKESSNGML